MARPRRYEERAARNDESRGTAEHHAEPWSAYEVEFLTTLWDGSEETLAEIAEELGRTIEACRQRYYTKGRTVTERVEVTRTSSRVEWSYSFSEEWDE